MVLNQEQVMAFLPHRDPFLFVDHVIEVSHANPDIKIVKDIRDLVGAKVVAAYETKTDHPIFAGHFPGHPILPGVVQVEMMAQASSFIISMLEGFGPDTKLDTALVSVSGAKFRKPVFPGMKLEIKTECTKCRGPMMANICELYHKGELMSQAEIMATVKMV